MEAHDGLRLTDRKIDEERGDVVAARRAFGPHTDGHQRSHRRARRHRLAPHHHPLAQRTGDDGEDDVVDRATVLTAYCLEVVEAHRHHAKAARLADRGIERVGRGRPSHGDEGCGKARGPTREALRGFAHVDRARAQRVDRGGRTAQHLGDGLRHELDVAGWAPRLPVHGLGGLGNRRGVEDDLSDVEGTGAIDHRVVRLGEQREPSALQPLDQIHLPERTIAIERSRHEATDEIAQLGIGARAWQRGPAYVIADVEFLVVDPHRVGQPPRDRAHLLPIARHESDACLDQVPEAVVVESALGLLEQHDPTDVHRGRRLLQVEERHVEWTEPVGHRASSPRQQVRRTRIPGVRRHRVTTGPASRRL